MFSITVGQEGQRMWLPSIKPMAPDMNSSFLSFLWRNVIRLRFVKKKRKKKRKRKAKLIALWWRQMAAGRVPWKKSNAPWHSSDAAPKEFIPEILGPHMCCDYIEVKFLSLSACFKCRCISISFPLRHSFPFYTCLISPELPVIEGSKSILSWDWPKVGHSTGICKTLFKAHKDSADIVSWTRLTLSLDTVWLWIVFEF